MLFPCQSERKGVNQYISIIALVKENFPPHCGHANAVPVAPDSSHNAPDEIWGALVIDGAKAQRVHGRDGPGAHSKDVAQNSSHAGCGALVRFDEGWMVVAFHFEDRRKSGPDVDYPRVLARPLQYALSRRREQLQKTPRAFVAAVFRPHH